MSTPLWYLSMSLSCVTNRFNSEHFKREVIDGLNMAYGKSSLDKLYQIRRDGFVGDYDLGNILPEELLKQYHQEVSLSFRKIP